MSIVQNYLMINENNVVDNICLWDGDVNTWTPPSGYTMEVDATTTAMIWIPVIVDNKNVDYVLEPVLGAGDIGFTWDGTVVTTPDPKPEIVVVTQPTTIGTQPA